MKRKRSEDDDIVRPDGTTLKVIDPDGDLLIILTPSTEPFAEWPSHLETQSLPYELEEESNVEERPATAPLNKVEFKVSKKHLMSACPRFKKMFSGPWLEATTMHPDGLFHVEIEGFDADAFAIVLHLIHASNSTVNVPRVVSIELLAKIALVVDDLKSYAAVQVMSEVWVKALKPLKLSTRSCDRTNVMCLWMIGCVFAEKTMFRLFSKEAIWESRGACRH